MPSPIPVTMAQPTPSGEGLLSGALPLPAGWERGGVAFLDPNCLLPVVMGQCPTGSDLKPTQRADSAEFRTYSLIMAVECSTLGGLDVAEVANTELPRTGQFALARELLTGAASERDTPAGIDPNPSLVGTATDLGEAFTSVADALACLESQLAEANAGRGGVILMPIGFATQALAERVLWRDGARWRTVTGNPVMISGGFDGRGPGDTTPPAADAPLYAYATTAVWAGVGRTDTYGDVAREVNTAAARAEQVGLAAFSTCAVFAAASTTATAC